MRGERVMCAKKLFYSFLLLFLFGMLSACGGGDSADSSVDSSAPPPPVGPSVIGVSPLQDSDTALVITEVTVRFSKRMDPLTINANSFLLRLSGSGPVSGEVDFYAQYNGHDNVAVFVPTNDLDIGKEYIATLTTEITDTDGEPLSIDYVWSFFIASSPAPVSIDETGDFGNNGIEVLSPSVPNSTGEYIVFASTDNFAGIDTGGISQIYRKNMVTGRIEIVSASNFNHNIADADSVTPRISDSGRYVVFSSSASNLISCIPTHGKSHIYLKDMRDDSIMLLDLSITNPGEAANGNSSMPDISGIPDTGAGKYVVFESTANDLHIDDKDTTSDIFIVNVETGDVELVSASTDQANKPANGPSYRPRVSNDGNRVVFDSVATNLIASDTNGNSDVFLRMINANTTTRLSETAAGDQVSGGNDGSTQADISADGVYVVFQSDQPTLDDNINNNKTDIFIRKTDDASTIKTLSLADGDTDGANGDSERPSISADGRYITFESEATDLVASDTNDAVLDIFVRERNSTTISLLSVDNNNTQGDRGSIKAVISANGCYISFTTSNNFNTADGNDNADIYRVHNAELR